MRFKDQRAIRRRRKNQGQNYTRLFLKGRPGNYPPFVVILNSVISKTKQRVLNKLFTKGYLNPRRRAMGKSRLVCCRSNAYFLLLNLRGRLVKRLGGGNMRVENVIPQVDSLLDRGRGVY